MVVKNSSLLMVFQADAVTTEIAVEVHSSKLPRLD